MFKEFLLKKMLKSQGVGEEQINMVLKAIEKNPELFKKISQEIQTKVAAGSDQTSAALAVLQNHQAELKELLG